MISSAAADLRRYPASAAAYLLDGLPPNPQWGIKSDVRMPQDRLKATIAQLAAQGPRDFYEGDLAQSIAADVRAAGGALSVEDLAAFRAHRPRAAENPLSRRQGVRDAGAHGGSDAGAYAAPAAAGFQARAARRMPRPTSTYAAALQAAYRERLKDMGDAEGTARARRRSIWRRPAPRISRWSTATATWRR